MDFPIYFDSKNSLNLYGLEKILIYYQIYIQQKNYLRF